MIDKFLLLILINLPIVLIGVTGAIASYKTSLTSKKRCVVEIIFWLLVGIGLIIIEPVYDALIASNLTDSGTMSIFDIALLTLLLLSLLLIVRGNEKMSAMNKKLSRLHEHIAIKDAEYECKIK